MVYYDRKVCYHVTQQETPERFLDKMSHKTVPCAKTKLFEENVHTSIQDLHCKHLFCF